MPPIPRTMLHLALALAALAPLALAQGPRVLFNNTQLTGCLGVRTPALNAPVEVISCFDRTAHLDWVYTYPGDNLSFQLKNTTLCLDAGTNPHDGGALKLYTCYPGLAAQHWWFTYDERIALTGDTHQCVDNDNTPGGRGLQTWTCTDKDTHQIWTPSGPF